MENLIGQQVQVWCNYIYTGKLVEVNERYIVLEDASIVYKTGPLDQKGWEYSQQVLPKHWGVCFHAIEAFAVVE